MTGLLVFVVITIVGAISSYFRMKALTKEAAEKEMEYIPQETPKIDPPAPLPPNPTPMPPEPKYRWDTQENARHSVRMICDDERLTVDHKNKLCATVGAESGWQSFHLTGPKKGQPVKLENKKNGVTWSTDWGICQINDYFHIGKGKSFPTADFVLDNPEACIRWMCRHWKAGHANWWVAYNNASWKRFLNPQFDKNGMLII